MSQPPEPDHTKIPTLWSDMPVGLSTFKGGLSEPIHRWFRLTPSFGPSLVDQLMSRLGVGADSVVLDPFSGAGTTVIQARRQGVKAVAVELNPLLHFVSRVRAQCVCSAQEFQAALGPVLQRAREEQRLYAQTAVQDLGIPLPPIHDVFRWWRPDVLRDLLLLRRAIEQSPAPEPLRELLMLTLLGVLVPDLSNVSLGRLQLHFVDRSADKIEVLSTFAAHAQRVLEDLEREPLAQLPPARVLLADSTQTGLDLGARPTMVITSPPYPNRYSYVWNTRPHLYFAGLFTGKRDATELDLKAIGGTWGTATSILGKSQILPRDAAVERVCGPLVQRVRALDPLMANYLMKYWNQLSANVQAVLQQAAEGVQLAYVIGCSRIKGEYVAADLLLAQLFQSYGLGEVSVERFRRRHSDKDLFESVVFGRR